MIKLCDVSRQYPVHASALPNWTTVLVEFLIVELRKSGLKEYL